MNVEMRNDSPKIQNAQNAQNVSSTNNSQKSVRSADDSAAPSEFKALLEKGIAREQGKQDEVSEARENKASDKLADDSEKDDAERAKISEGLSIANLAAMLKGSAELTANIGKVISEEAKAIGSVQGTGGIENPANPSKGINAEGNPGLINLTGKLAESDPSVVYDPKLWQEKPVQEIMGEIKSNRIAEKESTQQIAGTLNQKATGTLANSIDGTTMQLTDKALAQETEGSSAGSNSGKLKLIEKLAESSPNTVYDPVAWQQKSVQEIMNEIKSNRIMESKAEGLKASIEQAENSSTITELEDGQGKLRLMEKLAESNPNISYDELVWQQKSVQEIMNEIKSNRIQGKDLMNLTDDTAITNSAALIKGISEVEKKTTDASVNLMNSDVGASAQDASKLMAYGADGTSFNTNLPEAAKSEPYVQINREILTKLEQKGPMEFTMQLKPEDLGTIDIKMKISEGKLVIDIMAASPKTQNILASQVDKLVANLGLQNVKVENIQISAIPQGITEQQYVMNGGMGFFQRRNQEQTEKQDRRTGAERAINRIGAATETAEKPVSRMMTNKMDYAV